MRTVEQIAPETIAELIPQITRLTTDQPTTAEIEDALKTSKALTRAIFEWLSSRYSAKAAAGITAVPEEPAASVHPVFAPLLASMQRPA